MGSQSFGLCKEYDIVFNLLKASLVYEIMLLFFIKSERFKGEKNLAVPLVGSTWLGPAK